jgi:hypothetical protein
MVVIKFNLYVGLRPALGWIDRERGRD